MQAPVKFDLRKAQAQQFAAQIMAIVGEFIENKNAAHDALCEAAYESRSCIATVRETIDRD